MSGPSRHVRVVAFLTFALMAPMASPPTWAEDATATPADAELEAALRRAVTAGVELAHSGRVTAVSFSDRGPQVSSVDLTRGAGGLLIERERGWQLGRVGGQGFLRSADTLLRVGGVERVPVQLDRLRSKYALRSGRTVQLDTGTAQPLELIEHASGVLREVLYVDDATGLIVRRETFDLDGKVVRVVAYTELTLATVEFAVPAADGLDVREHHLTESDVAELRTRGFAAPAALPSGYELLTAVAMAETTVPTAHLVYSDGLYTISVFEQQGRMARTAVRGGTQLTTPDGGAAWRWPGSEPRRVVWSGDASTFTALSDAPTDELLAAIAGLPTDPPPSTLSRLKRGLQRVVQWFRSAGPRDDRSDS